MKNNLRLNNNSGFSLTQLMIVVAIVAILVAIALPSFQKQIANTKLETKSKELLNAIKLARSEAIKRGIPMSICPSNADGTGCENVTVFSENGWIVFSDEIDSTVDEYGNYDKGEDIILYRKGDSSVEISLSQSYIRFDSDGYVADTF